MKIASLNTFLFLCLSLLFTFSPSRPAMAQAVYGQRLSSQDGQWRLPVASRFLCSTAQDHLGRGSVNAWDLCAPANTPIFAAAPGRVILANCGNQGGYGCWVKIDHGNGITSSYAHMVKGSILVNEGQQVDMSTPLGAVGWTGMTSFGPHVHFVIQRNGEHIDPARLFDISQMQYCKLCAAPAGSAEPVGMAQNAPRMATSRLESLWTMLITKYGNLLPVGAMTLFFALAAIWWLGEIYERVAIVAAVVTVTVGGTMFWLSESIAAEQPATTIGGDATWRQIYPIIQGNEGWKGECVYDPVRTKYGVTQSTYDRWRRAHGQQPANVCDSITLDQAQQVFYEFYWLASGSHKLPARMALTVTDHYINTGAVAAGIAMCGLDVVCFNKWRLADYQGKSNCPTYCKAWFNRVNHIRKFTE